MSATIRAAIAADLDAIAPWCDAYRQFYDQPADPARARTFVDLRLRHGDSVILLARRDDVAIGFTPLYPLFSTVRTGRLWQLNDLYVAPPARRHGVGSALGLPLEMRSNNAATRRLCLSLGWQRDDRSHLCTLAV